MGIKHHLVRILPALLESTITVNVISYNGYKDLKFDRCEEKNTFSSCASSFPSVIYDSISL